MELKTGSQQFPDIPINLLKKIMRASQIFGPKKVAEKIRELYAAQNLNNDEKSWVVAAKIMEETAKLYGISSEMIEHSNQRGIVIHAKVMVMILLHKHIDVQQVALANAFMRREAIVSRRIRAFYRILNGEATEDDMMNEKIYSDPKFMPNFRYLDEKITEYKNSINQ